MLEIWDSTVSSDEIVNGVVAWVAKFVNSKDNKGSNKMSVGYCAGVMQSSWLSLYSSNVRFLTPTLNGNFIKTHSNSICLSEHGKLCRTWSHDCLSGSQAGGWACWADAAVISRTTSGSRAWTGMHLWGADSSRGASPTKTKRSGLRSCRCVLDPRNLRGLGFPCAVPVYVYAWFCPFVCIWLPNLLACRKQCVAHAVDWLCPALYRGFYPLLCLEFDRCLCCAV